MNPILAIDGYKLDHRRQYPKGTTRVYSNFTPRASRVEGQKEVVFFGLQYFLHKYVMDEFDREFFERPKDSVVREYTRRVNAYLGPNKIGTEHIAALHDLGYIPLRFKALAEGTRVPLRVPMFTVENTHPDFFWLVNYFETLLSATLWLPCTSATTAYRYRKLFDDSARRTSDFPSFVGFQGHDFSFRGMGGIEAASLSGAGHLLSFVGTDTIPAIELLEDYYKAEGLIGASVAATEHSVMSAGGPVGERETFLRLLELYPEGIVSVVSDTWDFFNVLTVILPSIKDKIMARNGKLVIRPDSGDPVKIIAGDPDGKTEAERKGTIELLWDTFGGNVNSKGYKELDSHIGAIYGDSITYERAEAILKRLEEKKFSSTNIVFGIGSYTYQYVTRDTFGFAMKATWAEVNGEGRALYKSPKTDDGTKWSARGRLSVLKIRDTLVVQEVESDQDEMKLVWENGKFIRRTNLEEIRKTLNG